MRAPRRRGCRRSGRCRRGSHCSGRSRHPHSGAGDADSRGVPRPSGHLQQHRPSEGDAIGEPIGGDDRPQVVHIVIGRQELHIAGSDGRDRQSGAEFRYQAHGVDRAASPGRSRNVRGCAGALASVRGRAVVGVRSPAVVGVQQPRGRAGGGGASPHAAGALADDDGRIGGEVGCVVACHVHIQICGATGASGLVCAARIASTAASSTAIGAAEPRRAST